MRQSGLAQRARRGRRQGLPGGHRRCGRLSLALVEAEDSALAAACRQGLLWEVLSERLEDEVKEGVLCIQAACADPAMRWHCVSRLGRSWLRWRPPPPGLRQRAGAARRHAERSRAARGEQGVQSRASRCLRGRRGGRPAGKMVPRGKGGDAEKDRQQRLVKEKASRHRGAHEARRGARHDQGKKAPRRRADQVVPQKVPARESAEAAAQEDLLVKTAGGGPGVGPSTHDPEPPARRGSRKNLASRGGRGRRRQQAKDSCAP